MTNAAKNAKRLMQFAKDHYPTKEGQTRWDIIVECWSLEEIEAEIYACGLTYVEGKAYAKDIVTAIGDAEAEVRAEIW